MNEYDFMIVSQIFFNSSALLIFIGILFLIIFNFFNPFNLLFLFVVFFILFFSGIYFSYRKTKLEADMIQEMDKAIKEINEVDNDIDSEKVQEL